MTQQEFSELTGKDITAPNFTEEYVQADRIYMAAGDLDKQTFCKDYRKSGATATLCALTERVEKQAETIRRKNDAIRSCAYAIIDTLLEIEDIAIANTVYAQAVKLIGIKECIKYKLEKNYALLQRDRDFLLSGIDSIPFNS